ncbi:hypothetical protein SY83_13430 [Paenibacillus swuensis]|uniref:Fibronectin type-III domain-containing protein n=1 Tax=Paenibacillus swuensis TaxID=1178515 RepID=A0A172TJF0_9BACL|nr:glycosyl hydrolase family 28-related protein [Paenibacillus swuensis]ANE47096.1 hypothetical protein SY83_13430 [Paenibacillus swuensis]
MVLIRRWLVCGVLVLAQGFGFGLSASAENIVFPGSSGANARSGIINVVQDHGADPTGATNAAGAIQNAINAARGKYNVRTVYFPNGQYRIDTPLVMATDEANHRGMILQGQSRDGVRLFVDSTKTNKFKTSGTSVPTAVISTHSGIAWTNNAFNTSIQNLKIDIGAGNDKAAGISYIASNQGCVCDVKIMNAAQTGTGVDLATQTIPGPSLIRNVEIQGFSVGVKTSHQQYTTTMENITLSGQGSAGILNDAHVVTVRNLTSTNTVSAVKQVPGGSSAGMLTLVKATLSGGASGNYAVDVQDGFVFARDVSATGYAGALRDMTKAPVAAVASPLSEYVSNNAYSLFESTKVSLELEAKETPALPSAGDDSSTTEDDPSNWADVTDPSTWTYNPNGAAGAVQGDALDDTAAIQAAMLSGKSTVYFTNKGTSDVGSRYRISDTITVGPYVKRIIGMYAQIDPIGTVKTSLPSKPLFDFVNASGSPSTILVEGLRVGTAGGRQYFARQSSSKTLIFKHISVRNGYGYRNTGGDGSVLGTGNVYMEDFHVLPNQTPDSPAQPAFIFKNQRAWARQLNPEQGNPNIMNDGARLWILGLKSEWPTTLVQSVNGGATEVLGCQSTPVHDAGSVPFFIDHTSSTSYAGCAESRSVSDNGGTVTSQGAFSTIVSETKGGTTSFLTSAALQSGGSWRKAEQNGTSAIVKSFVLPLYVGYSVPAQPTNLASSAGATGVVNLTWSDNTMSERSYVVERSLSDTSGWVVIYNSNGIPDIDAYSNTGLPSGTRYYYRVKATNNLGSSYYSNTVSRVVP